MTKQQNNNSEIPGMNLPTNYSPKNPAMPEDAEKVQKQVEKKKKELEKFKNFIIKKFKFIQAIGILPPQSLPKVIEEEIGENVPKEEMDKLLKKQHLYIIVPEDKFKEIPKIKTEIIKELEKEKLDVWAHVKTPIDVWETCLDSKFDVSDAIAMAYPLYDKGFLGALRVAVIHKSLVLQKFEKYVVSYVLAGSLVRGEAIETSDVDVWLIIDDTDVKRMPRLELKERLRSMIYQFVGEAESLAGVKNKLSPQVWLLTDFWDGIREAQPVYFTSLRDGVPLYDRHIFMPWKALLKMGKLKPSPEAVDMYMSMSDKTKDMVDRRLMDAAIDIYYSILTPSQAMIMLYGAEPPAHKKTPKVMKDIFYTKEKMLELKYINILEKAVKIFKDYEHQKIKTVKGAEIDKLLGEFEEYVKRIKELRKQIEKRFQEKTIKEIYNEIFKLLKIIFGNKTQEVLIKEFEKQLVKKAKMTPQHLKILNRVADSKKNLKKINSHEAYEIKKMATMLVNDLIDYTQRCDLMVNRTKMSIKYTQDKKEVYADLINADGKTFLVQGMNVKEIGTKITESSIDMLNTAIDNQKSKPSINVSPKVFEKLKKEIGDFEIIL